MADELWLTAGEAAEHCGVSLVTLDPWVCQGHLKAEGVDHRG
ncbi:hypothetical protein [Streptomyces salinarius]